MQFDWTTFALEAINFLVLLWILKRLLYKPVLEVLDARQKRISDQIQQAEVVRQDAERLREQYENRLAAWQQEQEESRQIFAQELANEQTDQLYKLRQSLAEEMIKERARKEALMALQEEQLAEQAKNQAFAASAAMLERLASKELTENIVQVLEQDLLMLSDQARQTLNESIKNSSESKIEIACAHLLEKTLQQRLKATISKVLSEASHFSFIHKPELIAGLHISIGERLLQANLRDELNFFREHEGHAE